MSVRLVPAQEQVSLDAPAAQLYADIFASRLLQTEPGTEDHLAAFDAYVLATVVAVRKTQPNLGAEDFADQLNTSYLRRLAETARATGAAVLIPSLNWDNEMWRMHTQVARDAITVPPGKHARWRGIFDELLSGELRIHDPREFENVGAFVRRPQDPNFHYFQS